MLFFKKRTSKDYADSASIPDNERQYYNEDSYYRFKPFADAAKVIPYEKRIKTARKTSEGLYPPEVIGIYFCHSHPGKRRRYPGWYWFKYGIRDVGKFQRSLEAKGLIEMGDDGQWRPTDSGEMVVKNNHEIIFAHQHIENIDFPNAWTIQEELEKISLPSGKKWTWRDRYWALLENYKIKMAQEGQIGLYHNAIIAQAEFVKWEGNYAKAAELFSLVAESYRRNGSFDDFPEGEPPGLLRQIEICRNKIKSKEKK